MSDYDVPERYEVVKRALISLGLEYKHAKKHDVATCPKTGHKTTIPRHKSVNLNKFTVGSIIKFLLRNGYELQDIKRALKWN